MTEMLKGTLEGIVLATLGVRPAYGYEITAWLREQGFSDIAEGTVYALLIRIEQHGLVDVEKVPPRRGRRARCTRSTPGDRNTSTSSGERGASSRNGSNSSMKEADDHVHLEGDRRKTAVVGVPGARQGAPGAVSLGGRCDRALSHVLRSWRRHRMGGAARGPRRPFEQAAADGTPIREIVGDDPEEFVEAFVQNYPEGQWVIREQERLRNTIARAAGEGTRNDERAVR